MRVLVLGKSGQLAQELARSCWPQGWRPTFATRTEIDLSEPQKAAHAVREWKPDLVINAAAYTAVDQAESEFDLAMRINGVAPGELANVCEELHVPFISASTDY